MGCSARRLAAADHPYSWRGRTTEESGRRYPTAIQFNVPVTFPRRRHRDVTIPNRVSRLSQLNLQIARPKRWQERLCDHPSHLANPQQKPCTVDLLRKLTQEKMRKVTSASGCDAVGCLILARSRENRLILGEILGCEREE